jgi:hypothetical protein
MTEAEQDWPRLIQAVKEHLEAATPMSDPAVRTLAHRWRELVRAFTGGDRDISETLAARYADPQYAQPFGLSPDLLRYVGEALEGHW